MMLAVLEHRRYNGDNGCMHAPVPYTRPRPPVAVSPLIRDDVALSQIPANDWNRLTHKLPLLSHAYFSALHRTRCASPETGWTPRFLTAWDQGKLIGATLVRRNVGGDVQAAVEAAWRREAPAGDGGAAKSGG